MFNTVVILLVIVAFLLIFFIIIQNPKGGLDTALGTTGSNQMFGVQKTGDILEKITWGLAAFILIFSIVSTLVVDKSEGIRLRSTTSEKPSAPTTAPLPSGTLPAPAKPLESPK